MGIFRRFRAVFAFAALVALAACTTWQPYDVASTAASLPSRVRVTLEGGEQQTLVRPVMVGDTVLAGRLTRHGPEALRIPLASVQFLEARLFSPEKTVLVVGVTAGLVLLVQSLWSSHCGEWCDD